MSSIAPLINIYNTPQVVTVVMAGQSTGATLMNFPINRTDFRLTKGTTNEVMFFVKDTDRHPVTVSNMANAGITAIRIIITDPTTNTLLLGTQTVRAPDGDASVLVPAQSVDNRISPDKGVWALSLDRTDTAEWPNGYLRYSIVADRTSGDQVMLYTDRNYGQTGGLELFPGPFPAPPEAYTIYANACTNLGPFTLVSTSVIGAAQVGNISGIQQAVAHIVDFRGSITLQASLENEAPQGDTDWFAANVTSSTVGTISYGNGTVSFTEITNGAVLIESTGNYMWMRFVVYTDNFTPGASWSSIDYRND